MTHATNTKLITFTIAILAVMVLSTMPAHAATIGVPGTHISLSVSQFGYGGDHSPPVPAKIDELLKTIPQKIVNQINSILANVFSKLHLAGAL